MRLGVLDVGSNTVHFLVVDAYHGAAPLPAHSSKAELRLAEHLRPDDSIPEDAVSELCDFAADAVIRAEDLGVTELVAFATSAVRDASNAAEVIETVRRRTGVQIRALTGPDEARLTFLAVRRWFGWSSGRLLVLDIGGGSLEVAAGDDEVPDLAVSLPLGAGRLTRLWLPEDPPTSEQVRALRREVRTWVGEVAGQVARGGVPRHAVATSKTFRQLARIAGAAPSAEGPFVRRELHREDLRTWLPKLAEMSSADRALLPGVSEGRAGQLVAGALVAQAAMDLLEVPVVQVAPWALREGVILRRLDALRDPDTSPEPS
jgi:exopolyphosphatase/guanosine-5'-triphosphate,3'-diphosphate pyrophosphatase